jgi:hypothetical protein
MPVNSGEILFGPFLDRVRNAIANSHEKSAMIIAMTCCVVRVNNNVDTPVLASNEVVNS